MTKLIINNIFSPIDIISLEAICPFLKWPYFLVSWFDRDVSTCSTFNCKFQTVHFQTFNIINKATKKNSKQKNHKPTPYLSPTHKLKHLLFSSPIATTSGSVPKTTSSSLSRLDLGPL